MPLDHPHDALPPGYRLEGYEILRVLGRGGFGITYQARRACNSGDMVAIKELFPVFTAQRVHQDQVVPLPEADRYEIDSSVEMFVREAEIICALNHPHIVRGIDAFRANGTAYLVMRYVSGRNLRESLRDPAGFKPSPQSLPGLLLPMLDALETLHRHELIHGDIKPDNIYLGVGFEPILIDLGAARRHVPGHDSEMAATYSQYFSAIEQVAEQFGPIGPWTDIYQLSAVIYRCISGGKLPDALDRLDADDDRYLPLAEIPEAGGYSESLIRAVDSGLAMLPQKRPQNVRDWRNSMNLPPRPSPSTPPAAPLHYESASIGTTLPTMPSPVPPPSSESSPSSNANPQPTSRPIDPLLWIALALLVTILCVIVIIFIGD